MRKVFPDKDDETDEDLADWTKKLQLQRVKNVGVLKKLSEEKLERCGIPIAIASELYDRCHPKTWNFIPNKQHSGTNELFVLLKDVVCDHQKNSTKNSKSFKKKEDDFSFPHKQHQQKNTRESGQSKQAHTFFWRNFNKGVRDLVCSLVSVLLEFLQPLDLLSDVCVMVFCGCFLFGVVFLSFFCFSSKIDSFWPWAWQMKNVSQSVHLIHFPDICQTGGVALSGWSPWHFHVFTILFVLLCLLPVLLLWQLCDQSWPWPSHSFQVSMAFGIHLLRFHNFHFQRTKASSFATFLSRLTLNILSLCNHNTKISFTILVVALVTGSFGTPGSVGIFSKLLKFDLTDDLCWVPWMIPMLAQNGSWPVNVSCPCVFSVTCMVVSLIPSCLGCQSGCKFSIPEWKIMKNVPQLLKTITPEATLQISWINDHPESQWCTDSLLFCTVQSQITFFFERSVQCDD